MTKTHRLFLFLLLFFNLISRNLFNYIKKLLNDSCKKQCAVHLHFLRIQFLILIEFNFRVSFFFSKLIYVYFFLLVHFFLRAANRFQLHLNNFFVIIIFFIFIMSIYLIISRFE